MFQKIVYSSKKKSVEQISIILYIKTPMFIIAFWGSRPAHTFAANQIALQNETTGYSNKVHRVAEVRHGHG